MWEVSEGFSIDIGGVVGERHAFREEMELGFWKILA
jgi:hypothetical protein